METSRQQPSIKSAKFSAMVSDAVVTVRGCAHTYTHTHDQKHEVAGLLQRTIISKDTHTHTYITAQRGFPAAPHVRGKLLSQYCVHMCVWCVCVCVSKSNTIKAYKTERLYSYSSGRYETLSAVSRTIMWNLYMENHQIISVSVSVTHTAISISFKAISLVDINISIKKKRVQCRQLQFSQNSTHISIFHFHDTVLFVQSDALEFN